MISPRAAKAVKAAILLSALAALTACTNTERFGGSQSEAAAVPQAAPAAAAEPTPPPPPQPPPVDLVGKWRLAAASGSACSMTLAGAPGAIQGSIAPAGGCPGNFFMSRKWTYEHDALAIRDYKGQTLVELSFTGDHFEGKDTTGGAITLARP